MKSKKKILALTLVLSTTAIYASEEWRDSFYLSTEHVKKCSASVSDRNTNELSVNLSRTRENRNIDIQFRSELKIEPTNNFLVADLTFESKNGKISKKRVRLKSYHGSRQRFVLNSETTTKETFDDIIRLIKKFDELYLITFDKKWVEYGFKFDLKNSTSAINKTISKCETDF